MGLLLPAFVSLSPFSSDCVFPLCSCLASLVKLESFQGSGPERSSTPEDIIDLSHPLLTTAFSASCIILC